MSRTLFMVAASVVALVACKPEAEEGKRKGAAEKVTPDTPTKQEEPKKDRVLDKHTVLVIDDGFDEKHQVFKGQVAATYRLVCDSADGEGGSSESSISDEKYAKEVIKSYGIADTSCSIKKGVNFTPGDDLTAVAGKKDAWNKKILDKTYNGVGNKDILDALSGKNSGKNYHGTMVAGVIAYQNEDTQLVFLQIELKKPNDDSGGECVRQKDLDQWVRVHKRKDVRDAYIKSPLDDATKKLYQIARDHNVTLVNMSYGSLPRAVIEEQLVEAGCDRVDFSEQFELQGKLTEERDAYLEAQGAYDDAKGIFSVASAGNEGTKIDSLRDNDKCYKGNDSVLSGSYDHSGRRSEFSNYGKCVNYYTLGSQVVTAAPLGLLTVVDGTSFSAPMLVRYISKTIPASAGPDKIKEKLDSLMDSKKFLPKSSFPNELAFENSKKLEVFALQDEPKKKEKRPYLSPKVRRVLAPLTR